jgi:hypothetical protein
LFATSKSERLKWLVETGVPVGAVHYYTGHEAVALGVCAALENTDLIASNHRGHGHCIAKGVDVRRMMAELYGKATGTNRGKGGSMHITDVKVGMLGVNPIVGIGATDALAQDDIKGEVVDVLTLSPLDESTILESVQRTFGKCRGRGARRVRSRSTSSL